MNLQPKYHRVLLKLSGEALANGQKDSILDFTFIDQVAAVLKKCLAAGVEIGIVVGAGNIWRGATGQVKMQRGRAAAERYGIADAEKAGKRSFDLVDVFAYGAHPVGLVGFAYELDLGAVHGRRREPEFLFERPDAGRCGKSHKVNPLSGKEWKSLKPGQ